MLLQLQLKFVSSFFIALHTFNYENCFHLPQNIEKRRKKKSALNRTILPLSQFSMERIAVNNNSKRKK